MDIEKLEFDITSIQSEEIVTDQFLRNCSLQMFQDKIYDRTIIRLIKKAGELQHQDYEYETQVEQYPRTWWDYFKQTYFSNWLLKYFPIEYKEITIRKELHIHNVFPEVKTINDAIEKHNQINHHTNKE